MTKSTIQPAFVLTAGVVISACLASTSSADMLFVFKKSATGGVNVTGSGSGLVNREAGIASSDWDIQDFMTDFLKDTFTDSQTGADIASGTFSNLTTGVSEAIISFDVDRDGGVGNDNDLDFDTENELSFSFEDEFLFELTATFEAATLPFDQLVIGRHIDVGRTQGAGIAEESFGIVTLIVAIPEPATLGLLASCLAAAGVLGLRRRA